MTIIIERFYNLSDSVNPTSDSNSEKMFVHGESGLHFGLRCLAS